MRNNLTFSKIFGLSTRIAFTFVIVLLYTQLSTITGFATVPISVADRNNAIICRNQHFNRNLCLLEFRFEGRLRRTFSAARRSRDRSKRSDSIREKTPQKRKKWLGVILKNSNGVINKVIKRKNWGKDMFRALASKELVEKQTDGEFTSNTLVDQLSESNNTHDDTILRRSDLISAIRPPSKPFGRISRNYTTTDALSLSTLNYSKTSQNMDQVIERSKPVSILGKIESSLFHKANEAYGDYSISSDFKTQAAPGNLRSNRSRDTAIAQSLELKGWSGTGILYATVLLILCNINGLVDSSVQSTESLSDDLWELFLPVSTTDLVAVIFGEGIAWLFEVEILKIYSRIVHPSFHQNQNSVQHLTSTQDEDEEKLSTLKLSWDSLDATPSEAEKDYDIVEIFADALKWSLYESLSLPLASLSFIFGNELMEHSYVQKAFVGLIAGLVSLMYADTLRQTFKLGKEEYIEQIEMRDSERWTILYITRIFSTSLLFGLYNYIMTECTLPELF